MSEHTGVQRACDRVHLCFVYLPACLGARLPGRLPAWAVVEMRTLNSVSGECGTAFEIQLFFILVIEYEVEFLNKEAK